MPDASLRSTPLPKAPIFEETFQGNPLSAELNEDYHSAIGELRYLADSTRFDIAFGVSLPNSRINRRKIIWFY